jgi:ankyrin repeat protein
LHNKGIESMILLTKHSNKQCSKLTLTVGRGRSLYSGFMHPEQPCALMLPMYTPPSGCASHPSHSWIDRVSRLLKMDDNTVDECYPALHGVHFSYHQKVVDIMETIQENACIELPGSKPYPTRVSTHTPKTPMVRQTQRVSFFLEQANLSPPPHIPVPRAAPVFGLQPSSPTNVERARLLLPRQSGHKAPEKHLRHKWLPSSRQVKSNHVANQPKKHEVALTFDKLLSQTPTESSSTAQAVLSLAPGTSLYELWRHFQDPKLENRMASPLKRMTSLLGRSQPTITLDPPWSWLIKMTGLEDITYIRLMCQTGLKQEELDWILGAALPKHSLDVIEVLLGYGAVASSHKENVRKRLRQDGLALATLLLSAPDAMSVDTWRYSLEPYRDSPSDVLLLCLAQRPDVVCGSLLLKALEMEDFPATAIILAYASSNEDFCDVRHNACRLATRIESPQIRHDFFVMLIESGCLEDTLILREELKRDVLARQLPLVEILASVGISVDVEPNNVVSWAISNMDFEVLELVVNGNFSSAVSPMLERIPSSTPEHDMLHLFDLLSPLEITGEPLDLHLIRAVEQDHIRLVEKLIQVGASVEYKQASAIRIAISRVDLDILDVLLRGEISPEAILGTISTAMALESNHSRLQAMDALLKKGVPPRGLDVPLNIVVTAEGAVDLELVQLLLQYDASVDAVNSHTESSVASAARKGNVLLLQLLCGAGPRIETVSEAVPVAFNSINTCRYEVTQSMIEILLSKGACGTPLHETLVSAAKKDSRMDIVRLLIKSGAKGDYKSGACYAFAIKSKASKLLKILCRDCPPSQECMASILPTAISEPHYDLPELDLLLGSTSSATAVLNLAWVPDLLKHNPNISTIIPCFLRHGIDVDVQDGSLLRWAIGTGDDGLLCKILDADPSTKSLRSAFNAAIGGEVKSIDVRALELLLTKAETAEIGQSEALVECVHLALAGDSEGLKFLLNHGAKVDYNDGLALVFAAKTGSLDTIKLLLASEPASSSIKRACLAVESSKLNTTQKSSIFSLLLDANDGLSTEDTSRLLNDCVVHNQENVQLAKLLLIRGAEISFVTLERAMARRSPELIVVMVGFLKDRYTLVQLFKKAWTTLVAYDKAFSIYRCLLGKDVLLGNPLSSNVKSEALLDSLSATSRNDTSLVKLLLQHGAMVGYRNGDAFRRALETNAVDTVILLSQYIADDGVANDAFAHALHAPLTSQDIRLEVYRCLLKHNIRGEALHDALVRTVSENVPSHSIMQLLLETGANPHKDGAVCFISAAKAGKEAAFRLLSKQAKLKVVLPALLDNLEDEHQIVEWYRLCLKETPAATISGQNNLLFACMRKFPLGTELLKLLLDRGVSASAMRSCSVYEGWKLEKFTALIWAILRRSKIGNNTILTLLSKGGREGSSQSSTTGSQYFLLTNAQCSQITRHQRQEYLQLLPAFSKQNEQTYCGL